MIQVYSDSTIEGVDERIHDRFEEPKFQESTIDDEEPTF
jgi:hypothetical protein